MPRPLKPILAMLLAATLLPACTPDTEHRGRVDTYETTDSEMKSREVLPTALMEFSDQTAQDFAQRINSLPEVRQYPGSVVVVLGDIENKTHDVNSNDIELVSKRVRSALLNSQFVGGKVKFIESRGRMEAIRQREGIGAAPADQPQFDPTTTFALNGDIYQIARGRTNQYFMEFNLTRFSDNSLALNHSYEVKQWQHKD